MKKYEIEIKSISPILLNVPKKELQDEMKKLKKDELAGYEEKNWQRKAEYNEKGEVIIPEKWLKGTLVLACKKTMMVPNFATSKKQTYTYYVESCQVQKVEPIAKSKKDLECFGEMLGAQGKNSPTKVWKNRPLVKNWSTSFLFIDPAGRMNTEELKEIIEYAGTFCGIGDNRKNNFGRFELVKIREVN